MISSAMSISPDPIELGKPVDVTFSGALNVDIPEDPSKTITQVPFVEENLTNYTLDYIPLIPIQKLINE